MDKISVIVPVYKVEAYLERCVNSLLNQTYRNLEIILVDDGSPDRCGEICDRLSIRDNARGKFFWGRSGSYEFTCCGKKMTIFWNGKLELSRRDLMWLSAM